MYVHVCVHVCVSVPWLCSSSSRWRCPSWQNVSDALSAVPPSCEEAPALSSLLSLTTPWGGEGGGGGRVVMWIDNTPNIVISYKYTR